MKTMLKRLTLFCAVCWSLSQAFAQQPATTVWSIGQPDGRASEFALAPDRFRDFLARDFGYEDKFYLVGHSDPARDLPLRSSGSGGYLGRTWPTSGWRTHQVNILFGLSEEPVSEACRLVVDLADYAKNFLPLVKVSVNDLDTRFQARCSGT